MMTQDPRATVLVVEDELFIRLVSVDALADAGYQVLEADNAAEALRVIENAGDVRVLFTDINMPGNIDGLDLARLVHARWPDIRLILTSGHVRLHPEELPDDGRFVSKPYRTDTVIAQIKNLLHSE